MLTMGEDQRRRAIFQDVYGQRLWGSDSDSKFFSGVGSRGVAVDVYVEKMAELIRDYAAQIGRPPVVVDIGCGDFQVGQALVSRLPDITYVGCDIVPELVAHNSQVHGGDRVRFQQLDVVVQDPPAGDICLIRQVLQHLSNADIERVLTRLRPFDLVYVTEGHPEHREGPVNPDKLVGAEVRFDWRTGRGRGVELDQPPYGAEVSEVFRTFAPPHEVIITQRVVPKA